MADLKNSKTYGTAIYPVHAQETSGLMRRCEPMLTPEQLVSRFLKGIPLKFRNNDQFTPADLKDRIYLASNQTELLLGCTINREAFKEKVAFDANLYRAYVHIKSEHGPIISLESLAIVSSDNQNVFQLPAAWIEAANFSKKQINVIPLLAAFGSTQVGSAGGTSGSGGIAFLAILGGMQWVPAYWEIKYTAGLSNTEGKIPTVVNELIGTVAAIDILSEIAATYIYNSQSQSQDGISQSSSGPGPNMYKPRIADLMLKKDELVKKLKAIFGSKYFVSNI